MATQLHIPKESWAHSSQTLNTKRRTGLRYENRVITQRMRHNNFPSTSIQSHLLVSGRAKIPWWEQNQVKLTTNLHRDDGSLEHIKPIKQTNGRTNPQLSRREIISSDTKLKQQSTTKWVISSIKLNSFFIVFNDLTWVDSFSSLWFVSIVYLWAATLEKYSATGLLLVTVVLFVKGAESLN